MMNRSLHLIFFSLLMVVTTVQGARAANDWKTLRWQFRDAYTALKQQDMDNFNRQWRALQQTDYPITHYLDYYYLRETLDTASAEDLQAFLHKYADSPIAPLLRAAWLQQLAKQKDWTKYQQIFTPNLKNTQLRCYHLRAQLETGQRRTDFVTEALNLWLTGRSQPAACDPAFKVLYAENRITQAHLWQRIRLLMANNKVGLARFIAKKLNSENRSWFGRWQSMHTDPVTTLTQVNYPDTPLSREIILYGLQRLLRRDAVNAYTHWQRLKRRYTFSSAENTRLFRDIALRSGWQRKAQAAAWLGMVDGKLRDEKVTQTHLQLFLRKQDWKGLLKTARQLPTADKESERWRYWQARALSENGDSKAAQALYSKVAKARSYYGFLAADRLNQAYQFSEKQLKVSDSARRQLLALPAVIKAQELLAVDLTNDAAREWRTVLETRDKDRLIAAMQLAHDWQWHRQAIVTAAKAGAFDVLSLRFPTPFYDTVLSAAEARELDYAWVYAIIRQESAFQVDALSSANAMGLMQLLPATAHSMAKRYNLKLSGNADILAPETNIQLGTGYLRYLLDRFDGNYMLATASYNAGPGRGDSWSVRYGCLPPDIWVELIPFQETRNYVQRVMSYAPVFEYRLTGNNQVQRMHLMPIKEGTCTEVDA